MTNQEIFNIIVAHLRKQNAKSESFGRCKYRSDTGLKCAVGCLITDDEYRPEMEGQAASYVFNHFLPKFDFSQAAFLDKMQYIHDAYDVFSWETYFKSIAEEYKLDYTPSP